MEWKQIPLGALQTNCYLLSNEEKQCILFDPGAEGEKLNSWLKEEGYRPLAILLTHAHFDHIGAVDEVRDHWKIPVYIHKLESSWLTDPSLNGSSRFPFGEPISGKPADNLLEEEGMLEIGPFTLQLLHTPGHSPGSISYYVHDAQTVFAGDTLFAGSIGRTDLPGGDHDQLLESIRSQLLTLPKETAVLPGHGPITSIKAEKNHNPFLK